MRSMKCMSSVDALGVILQGVDDLDLALRMADVADEITQTAFAAKAFSTHVKEDGTPVTDVDVAVEEELVRLLARHRPDDAALSEELGARGRSHAPGSSTASTARRRSLEAARGGAR